VTTRRAFGDTLRRHREQRGITLEDISKLTKISASLLAALERGDCSRWPAGIYSRAYIRDYAQAIGLDRDETAAEFAECFSETAFPDGTPPPKPDPPHTGPAIAPPATPLRMMIVDEPREHRREIARRSAAVVLDVLLSVGLAMVLNATIDAGFWMTLAIVSVCFHAAGIVRGRAHTIDALAHLTARRPSRQPNAAPESVFAEAA
jgi:cytoskeletal protein RodZ